LRPILAEAGRILLRVHDALDGLPDADLAARAQHGTDAREAFAELVRRYHPAVARFAARMAPAREDADEIAQETFLRAWHQIARFRPGTNFIAWLLTIARFLAMARRKELQRHPPPAPLEAVSHPAAPPLPESLERLRQAVDGLPLHQREVLAMRFFDGLDYRSIAEIVGESEVTLRSRLHDALERLKKSLGAPAK
jgi:RNA polymerase sigma-70 factor (ECF subfamily)